MDRCVRTLAIYSDRIAEIAQLKRTSIITLRVEDVLNATLIESIYNQLLKVLSNEGGGTLSCREIIRQVYIVLISFANYKLTECEFTNSTRIVSDNVTVPKNFEKIENLLCDQERETSINSVDVNIVGKVVNGIPLLRLDIGKNLDRSREHADAREKYS